MIYYCAHSFVFLLLIKLDVFDKIRCFSCNIFLCFSFENYLFRSLNFYGVLCIFLLLLTVSYICCIPDFPPSYCWLFSFLRGSFEEKSLFIFILDGCVQGTWVQKRRQSPGGAVPGGCESLHLLYSYGALAQHWLEMQAKETFNILLCFIETSHYFFPAHSGPCGIILIYFKCWLPLAVLFTCIVLFLHWNISLKS